MNILSTDCWLWPLAISYWLLVVGIWYLVFGIWYLAFGIWALCLHFVPSSNPSAN
jgi:hypothetical protein